MAQDVQGSGNRAAARAAIDAVVTLAMCALPWLVQWAAFAWSADEPTSASGTAGDEELSPGVGVFVLFYVPLLVFLSAVGPTAYALARQRLSRIRAVAIAVLLVGPVSVALGSVATSFLR